MLSEPRIGDAFGEMLLECHAAGAAPWAVREIIERDDGYVTSGDAGRYFAEPEAGFRSWPLSRAHGTVLDIGAGAGRYALALQERGHEVTALDVSEASLAVCRQRGARQTFLGTIDELPDDARFDTFLLMGNNLGLLENRERGIAFLLRLGELATDSAVIIGNGADAEDTDHPEHLAYHRRNRERGHLPGELRLRVRHCHLASEWFNYLFIPVDELAEIAALAGWQVTDHVRERPQYMVTLSRS